MSGRREFAAPRAVETAVDDPRDRAASAGSLLSDANSLLVALAWMAGPSSRLRGAQIEMPRRRVTPTEGSIGGGAMPADADNLRAELGASPYGWRRWRSAPGALPARTSGRSPTACGSGSAASSGCGSAGSRSDAGPVAARHGSGAPSSRRSCAPGARRSGSHDDRCYPGLARLRRSRPVQGYRQREGEGYVLRPCATTVQPAWAMRCECPQDRSKPSRRVDPAFPG